MTTAPKPSDSPETVNAVVIAGAAACYAPLNPHQLQLRASFAGELWREGKISRTECFRIEMDAALGRDTGPVTFEDNTEYQELLRVGWTPKRTQ